MKGRKLKSLTPGKLFIDYVGHRFGRLTIKSLVGCHVFACGRRKFFWNAYCECGSKVLVGHDELRRGDTKSCGCFQKESVRDRSIKHLQSNSPTYVSWAAMKQRCMNKNHTAYKNYGGRGIAISKRWINSFENFLADMGERPAGTSLDRIDNDGNYGPKNCRWATRSQQAKNSRPRERGSSGRIMRL
jgi:hypothetical protein